MPDNIKTYTCSVCGKTEDVSGTRPNRFAPWGFEPLPKGWWEKKGKWHCPDHPEPPTPPDYIGR